MRQEGVGPGPVVDDALLRDLLDGANDILYVHDLEGRILWANDTAARLLGYSAEDLRTLRIPDLVAPSSLDNALDQMALKGAGARERSDPYELELRRADGSTAWFEVSSRLWRDSSGRPALVHGIARDISQRHHATRGLELVGRLAAELNDVPDVVTALGKIVRSLSLAAGWPYGEAWVAEDGILRPTEAYYTADPNLGRFRRVSRQAEYGRGEGLLGTVCAEGRTRWVRDVAREPLFHLGANALSAGLRSVVAVPVQADGFQAVLVWMQSESRDADAHWVQVADAVANQLSGLVARRRVEDRLRWQTAVLNGHLEAAPYAVMVVSEQGEVVAANSKMLGMCRVRHVGPLVGGGRSVAQHIDDPVRFNETARYLYEDPGQDGVVELRGKRYRRASTRIHDEDDLPMGRVVTFEELPSGVRG